MTTIDRDTLERLFQRYLTMRYQGMIRSGIDPDEVEWEKLAVDSDWSDDQLIANIELIMRSPD